jgi:uncharacterized protein GlcG (DUF336 family)
MTGNWYMFVTAQTTYSRRELNLAVCVPIHTAQGSSMPRAIQTLTLADARAVIAGGENQAVALRPFIGGIPMGLGEFVVGAVGTSGGTVDQDIKLADAAVAALKLT